MKLFALAWTSAVGAGVGLGPAVGLGDGVAVRLGQTLLPKSDPTMYVYDHQGSGFRYALTIPRRV